jgi:hypothetical protein
VPGFRRSDRRCAARGLVVVLMDRDARRRVRSWLWISEQVVVFVRPTVRDGRCAAQSGSSGLREWPKPSLPVPPRSSRETNNAPGAGPTGALASAIPAAPSEAVLE